MGDRLRPVIPEAGIPYKLTPEPEKEPSLKLTVDPVMLTDPVNVCMLEVLLPNMLEPEL
jgi:hypothetical protein